MPGSKVPEKNLLEVPEGIEDHDRGGGADGGDGGGVILAVLPVFGQTLLTFYPIWFVSASRASSAVLTSWRSLVPPNTSISSPATSISLISIPLSSPGLVLLL